MNILYICHYAGSPEYGMAYRMYYLGREWVKMGNTVTIVGASQSHLRRVQPTVPKDLTKETIGGVNFLWLKTPAYESSISRIVNIFSFVGKLNRYAKRIAKEYAPDLVINSSTYPLDTYPARKIARISGAKLCFEGHDIWPLTPQIIGGYPSWHPFIFVMQRAENYAYKHSDKVVSLLWNAEEHMKQHGLQPGKFKCIPNGYSQEEWTDDNAERVLPEEHRRFFGSHEDKFIVGVIGGLAISDSFETLIDAAEILRKDTQLHFVIVGKGPEREALEKYAANKGLTNFTILGPVPKLAVPAVIKQYDVAYMSGVHSILHKYGTSYNKLTDYMLASKPILVSIDEPGSVVERVGCGIQVEAENPEKVAEAITTLKAMTKEQRLQMGQRGYEYATSNLEWSTLAKDFLDFIIE